MDGTVRMFYSGRNRDQERIDTEVLVEKQSSSSFVVVLRKRGEVTFYAKNQAYKDRVEETEE